MTFLLPVVAATVALLILPGWSFYFDVVPRVVVALGGAALALVLSRQKPTPEPPYLKWFRRLIVFEAGAILVATLFSPERTLSLFGSTWRRNGLFAEIAVLILAVTAARHLATDRTRLRPLLRITVLAALPASIYGILQYFGIDPWIPPSGYHFGAGQFMIVRPPSTLGHAAYFATYLLFPVFAGAALARSEASPAWKAAALATSGTACVAIVLSGTRAGLAGLLVGAVFVAWRQGWSWKWLAGAFTLLVLVAGLYWSPAGEALRARVHWSSEDPLGGGRPWLWRDTLRMAGAQWLVGYGPETFAVEFPLHQSLELARAFPNFYHESPHNIFLDALISEGFLGLVPLVALAALGVRIAQGAIGGAFVAILVSQQFSAFTLPTELYFYLCLAILVSNFAAQGVVTIKPHPWHWVLAAPFACFALYLATGDAFLGSARRALDRGDLNAAARYAGRARNWNAHADIYFSRRFLTAGAWQYGMDAAQRAPQTADDRQNAWVNLAAFDAARNDASAVERSLREGIAAAPNWFKPHWLLAQVLAREGRVAEAGAEARAAVERDGGKTPEVTQVMEQLRPR